MAIKGTTATQLPSPDRRALAAHAKLDHCGHHWCAESAGCGDIAFCCVECPLEECRQDRHMSWTAIGREIRNARIMELRRGNRSVPMIADAVGLSERRVQHVLRREGIGRKDRNPCICCGEAFTRPTRDTRRCEKCQAGCPVRGPHRFQSAPLTAVTA